MHERIKRLEREINDLRKSMFRTVFLLEDGSEFETNTDPVDYLVKHGTDTPNGKIASYPHPRDVDPLSDSLYEFINDAIQNGGIDFGNTVGDELEDLV